MAKMHRVKVPDLTNARAHYIASLVGCQVREVYGALIMEALSRGATAEAESVVRDRLREYRLSITEDEDGDGAQEGE
jgi:hypothetical protein